MNRFLPLLAAVVLVFALPLAAEKKNKDKNAPPCPVSGKPASAAIFAAHKGGRVFFHSDESKQKFTMNKEQYTGAANYQLFLTGQARQIRCPIRQDKALGPTAINVGGIGVCCPGCQRKIAGLNPQQRLALMFGANFDKLYRVARSP